MSRSDRAGGGLTRSMPQALDHVICANCGKVVEFCDPRVQQIKDLVADLLNFQISHHSLNLYGVCGTCQKEMAYGVLRKEAHRLQDDEPGWGD